MLCRRRCPGAAGAPLSSAAALLCALVLTLAAAPALATCPPEDPSDAALECWNLSDYSPLPPSARPVLTMQARGVWNHTCNLCSDSSCTVIQYGVSSEGTGANLTGGGFEGQFYYKPSGWDAVALLWHEGSNKTQDYAVLTMPLSSQTLCNPSNNREVRFQVTGCSTGTAGSLQEGLPLPPIYLAVRSDYSEPSPQPPPPSEEERATPASCNPNDPAQASLTFPWSGVFTFYTC